MLKMTVPSRWDTLLSLLKRSQFLYGPGLSLMRENVRKMWLDKMVTRADSSFLIHGPDEPLKYYRQLCELRNDNIPFSIGHISSPQTDMTAQSEHLKPLWNFGGETSFKFLHFCAPSSANSTFDQLVNVRYSWWKRLSYNSADFTLSNMDETSTVLSGRHINYMFPWGLETVETICNMGDEHVQNVHNETEENVKYVGESKYLHPYQIQCDMTLEMATAVFLNDAFVEKKVRKGKVLHLNPALAPFKVGLCREGTKTEQINEVTKYIAGLLRKQGNQILDTCDKNNNIDLQLQRFDEMGIPFIVIVDNYTIESGTVKIRNRDTAIKETLAISDLPLYVTKHVTYQPLD